MNRSWASRKLHEAVNNVVHVLTSWAPLVPHSLLGTLRQASLALAPEANTAAPLKQLQHHWLAGLQTQPVAQCAQVQAC